MHTIMSSTAALRVVKLLHTVIWALMVGCILAVPVLAWMGDYVYAALCAGVVLVECFVLLVHGGSCPLTAIAARYTEDRRDNFDIYLPLWLARHNKVVFGVLYLAGVLFAATRWAVGSG